MNCKDCIYSGNCYHEVCYTQMQTVCECFSTKKQRKSR